MPGFEEITWSSLIGFAALFLLWSFSTQVRKGRREGPEAPGRWPGLARNLCPWTGQSVSNRPLGADRVVIPSLESDDGSDSSHDKTTVVGRLWRRGEYGVAHLGTSDEEQGDASARARVRSNFGAGWRWYMMKTVSL